MPNRLKNKLKGWAFYIPNKKAAGGGIRDFYGSTYTIGTDGALRLVDKVKHQTR